MVLKAEVDGYDITTNYNNPSTSWIYLDENGSLHEGQNLTNYSGTWQYNNRPSDLSIKSSSILWGESIWKADFIDSVLFLAGTGNGNNITNKVWLVPGSDNLPPYRQFTRDDEALIGTWRLVRVRRNLGIVAHNNSSKGSVVPEITFFPSGLYTSNMNNHEAESEHGVWSLDHRDRSLSIYPMDKGESKVWTYNFRKEHMYLKREESIKGNPILWEWLWVKI